MALEESVNNFFGKLEYILQQWTGHGIPNAYLTGILVGGLYRPEFKIAIKEKNPRDLTTVCQII